MLLTDTNTGMLIDRFTRHLVETLGVYYKVGCRIIQTGASEVSERELVEQTDHDVAVLIYP